MLTRHVHSTPQVSWIYNTCTLLLAKIFFSHEFLRPKSPSIFRTHVVHLQHFIFDGWLGVVNTVTGDGELLP